MSLILDVVLGLNIRNEVVITDYLGYREFSSGTYSGEYSIDLRTLPHHYRMKLLLEGFTPQETYLEIHPKIQTSNENVNKNETSKLDTFIHSIYKSMYHLFYYTDEQPPQKTKFWVADVL